MAKGKYDSTLNLPKTDFPMRANLPTREPETTEFWENNKIYEKLQQKNEAKPTFILHDGPPYANGDIHLGHTLNKVLKDIIVRQRSLNGYNAPYVPGWDTHGLPIEQQAIKNMGLDRNKTDVVEFRQHCKDYALKYVDIQKDQFKRLGVIGDWDNPYITLNPEFESVQVKVFGEMASQGYIYKGLKPVYWCGDCETALAEAEVEYNDKVSPSIFVKFPVTDGKEVIPSDSYILIWTTTPWTIPANTGISVNPELDYVVCNVNDEKYVFAKGLLERLVEEFEWSNVEIISELKGELLELVVCKHPIFNRDSLVILGDHVNLDAGTGCVHTAPGHGEDDFFVGQKYDLPVISPVDNGGLFTDEAYQFAGLYVQDANAKIISELEDLNMLVNKSNMKHQYPFCWRCKHPIIFRATEQWFASIDGFRENALNAIDSVQWIPAWGRERIYNMVRDRGDWCISRQRTWGVPIPIFYCNDCGESIVNNDTIAHISDLFAKHGSDIWFEKNANDLVPTNLKCDCGNNNFRKETDIMDVWFDSGSSHMAVLETTEGLSWPADLYLEGSDQHRGWFNSSLSTAVAVKGTAPYRSVLTHGFVVDEKGRKMSKSLGNVIDPLKMIDQMGADILRLWVASADYRSDVAVSKNIIKQCAEAYRKIRNTCRFILGNISDFDPNNDKVPYEQLTDLDKWALLKMDKLNRRVTKAFDNYEFHVVFHSVHNFCTIDLSNLYFDVLKDKLYCSHPNDPERRAAQTVLHELITNLVILLTPILAFTTEEIWRYLRKENDVESILLLDWPEANDGYINNELENTMDKVFDAREVVTKALEEARNKKVIGHSLGAWVGIYADNEWYNILSQINNLEKILITSRAELDIAENRPDNSVALEDVSGLWVSVKPAEGEKCERCWIISVTVGENNEHPTLCNRCSTVIEQL
ncbi:Isoleucyl-tRNA synthetase [Candidatus Syntrophocurvum alkaliphilum]|uniref:Isoleucine--tRNA ligase n=1 Tax=Candidatus Syntrophocurvum alkaliphilum TaxID=2293317 RepID=A0A6I6DEZ0_9FIRM|nr:isoleucine--tRNA ligase [Candidatus Syntrophocurvum alkaliphilum]QGT99687.1 Isoleucyl-tRNA synthetase [Candidatus Syntrophocurvum alkaliphilum]